MVAPVLTFPAPLVLDDATRAHILSRSDAEIACAIDLDADAVIEARASIDVDAWDAMHRQLAAALSPAEREDALRALYVKAPLTAAERELRHSQTWQDRAMKRCAAFVRECLRSGDRVQQAERVAAPTPCSFFAISDAHDELANRASATAEDWRTLAARADAAQAIVGADHAAGLARIAEECEQRVAALTPVVEPATDPVIEIVAAALLAGRVSSVTIYADSDADLDERAAQLVDRGCETSGAYDCVDSDGAEAWRQINIHRWSKRNDLFLITIVAPRREVVAPACDLSRSS